MYAVHNATFINWLNWLHDEEEEYDQYSVKGTQY
jgi:hypothetical protein